MFNSFTVLLVLMALLFTNPGWSYRRAAPCRHLVVDVSKVVTVSPPAAPPSQVTTAGREERMRFGGWRSESPVDTFVTARETGEEAHCTTGTCRALRISNIRGRDIEFSVTIGGALGWSEATKIWVHREEHRHGCPSHLSDQGRRYSHVPSEPCFCADPGRPQDDCHLAPEQLREEPPCSQTGELSYEEGGWVIRPDNQSRPRQGRETKYRGKLCAE